MSTLDKTMWVRGAVAVPTLTREIHRVRKADDWDKDNKKGVHETVSETVHVHDVYHLLDGRGKALPDRWHRGARVASC
jgi:hypothetical protein